MDHIEYLKMIGRKGGQARANKLSGTRRKQIALMGARARYGLLSGQVVEAEEEEEMVYCKVCKKPEWMHSRIFSHKFRG